MDLSNLMGADEVGIDPTSMDVSLPATTLATDPSDTGDLDLDSTVTLSVQDLLDAEDKSKKKSAEVKQASITLNKKRKEELDVTFEAPPAKKSKKAIEKKLQEREESEAARLELYDKRAAEHEKTQREALDLYKKVATAQFKMIGEIRSLLASVRGGSDDSDNDDELVG